MSPKDPPDHAIVILSTASCSFGSENSVMIAIAEAEVVMQYPGCAMKGNKPRGFDAIICWFGVGGLSRLACVCVHLHHDEMQREHQSKTYVVISYVVLTRV